MVEELSIRSPLEVAQVSICMSYCSESASLVSGRQKWPSLHITKS